MSDKASHENITQIQVSVVMTTFNGEKYLEKQIDSILSQTHKPAEIIICDDASTDGTVELLNKYLSFQTIKVFQNETRLGVTENFKKAISLATKGYYISLCDQDDIWLPDKIEKSIVDLLEIDDKITPAMVYSDLILVDSNENILNSSLQNEIGVDKYIHCLQTLIYANFITGCTVVMNDPMRLLFQNTPNNKAFVYDSWLALIAFSFGKVKMLEKPTIKYRMHESNVTISNYKNKSRIQRLIHHFKSLFKKDTFLENQIILVKLFFLQYESLLSDQDKTILLSFLKLENSLYWKKKISFEFTFLKYWKNRF